MIDTGIIMDLSSHSCRVEEGHRRSGVYLHVTPRWISRLNFLHRHHIILTLRK